MNSVDIQHSILLKSDARARIANGHSETFASTVSNPDIRTFSGIRDATLAPGGELPLQNTTGYKIVLPLVGTLQAVVDCASLEIRSEQLLVLPGNAACLLQNSAAAPVNAVVFSMKEPVGVSSPEVLPVGLKRYDELVTMDLSGSEPGRRISIGVYRSRSEVVYKCADNSSEVLLFVVNGSFEAEGRLIEYRDSLVLWDINEIEIEALADDSILCIIENSKQH